MFSTSDTIVAVATPPGRGALGVVRLSGPDAARIAAALLTCRAPLRPRHATLTGVRARPVHGGQPSGGGEHEGGRTPEAIPHTGGQGPPEPSIDRVVALFYPRPASYTGEDVVEISAHGSPVVLRAIVAAAQAAGARLAEPGEFTLRAFLNGRLDLVQAEAVGDLVDAVTPLQARTAFDQLDGTLTEAVTAIEAELFDTVARLEASLDFPDEGYHFIAPEAIASTVDAIDARVTALLAGARRGRLIREGAVVAIAGKPNVGKSSLFNALVGTDRAIVAEEPGTTRDLVTELTELGGVRVTLVDTAGERGAEAEGGDAGWEANPDGDSAEVAAGSAVGAIERDGVRRAQQARGGADLVVLVLDRSRDIEAVDRRLIAETAARCRVVVANKNDLPAAWALSAAGTTACAVSVRQGEGLDALRAAIVETLAGGPAAGAPRDAPGVTNLRHIDLLARAQTALRRTRAAIAAADGTLSEEFVLADLQDALQALEEVTGKRTSDDLLKHIFSRFCIGK